MKCFFHSADLDGHCSGAIVKYAFPECEMIGVNYGDFFPRDMIGQGETVFVVDFCLQPFEDMKLLNEQSNLIWIDHHKSSINAAISQGFRAGGGESLDTRMAACELTWDYLSPTRTTPLAVYLLGRYDVWDHTDERTLPFQYGFRLNKDTYPNNQDLWRSVFEDDSFVESVCNDGKIVIQYEKSQNAKFCSAYAFESWIHDPANGDIRAICANRTFSNSQLFDSVYDPDLHDVMISFGRRDHKWVVSLYTTKDTVDCSIIAQQFGGGGHKQAAGFTCDVLPFEG